MTKLNVIKFAHLHKNLIKKGIWHDLYKYRNFYVNCNCILYLQKINKNNQQFNVKMELYNNLCI